VITSGQLIAPYFEDRDLAGAPCAVLGTDDSIAYVEQAGGEIVDPRHEDFEVLVLGDDAGFAFREAMDAVLTRLIHRFDAGNPPTLVLPNPDLIFQRGADDYGFAVGSLAEMFERVLDERFPAVAPTFDRLGKPHPPIYHEALRRADGDNVVMLGDQLATDIAGANRAGLDSVFVPGGVSNLEAALSETDVHPDWVLRDLSPEDGPAET
jgi:ribonucleotide monophosphatase NagD (HAD superfamily)